MIEPRMLWMLRPVERSITVSAPQWVAHTIFSTSVVIDEVTAEFADIGVDLCEEIPADDHRLGLRMIDVGRDDRPPARHFVAHEFRRHVIRDRRPEALAVTHGLFLPPLTPEVLADGNELHLRRDD